MARTDNGLGNIMSLIRMCEELREFSRDSGPLDLMHVHIASYCWEGLVGDATNDGLPMQELHKNLGYKTSTQVHRKLYDLADNPKMVRGRGQPCGWFTIVDDPEDGRFKRIKLTPRGASVAYHLSKVGYDDMHKVNRIREEHADLKATAKMHYHMTAETGEFHWSAVAAGEVGSDPKRPIPIEEFRMLTQEAKKRYLQNKLGFYWIDQATGHQWSGRPDRNPYAAKQKLEVFSHAEAQQMEKDNTLNKARGPKGQWHFWKPNADPYVDEPVGYLKDITNTGLVAYVNDHVENIRTGFRTPEEVMSEADWDLNKSDFQKFRKLMADKLRQLREAAVKQQQNAEKMQWEAAMREQEARASSRKAFTRANETPSTQMHDKHAYYNIGKNQQDIADSFAAEAQSAAAQVKHLTLQNEQLTKKLKAAENLGARIDASDDNREALRAIVAEELARLRNEGGTDEGN